MVLWGPPAPARPPWRNYWLEPSGGIHPAVGGDGRVREVRAAVDRAQGLWREQRRRTVLFVDEVHRFNKAQQDAFLPYVEDGTLTFIGATTENPGFALNNALLSRVRVYVLNSLDPAAIRQVVDRALSDAERGLVVAGRCPRRAGPFGPVHRWRRAPRPDLVGTGGGTWRRQGTTLAAALPEVMNEEQGAALRSGRRPVLRSDFRPA